MLQRLYEFVSYTQYSEVVGWVLLVVSAVLFAFFTEMLLQGLFHGKKRTLLKMLGICSIVFLLFAGAVLLLLRVLLHIFPQEESLWVLLKKIGATHTEDFIIPIVTALVAGRLLKGIGKKRWARTGICIMLVVTTLMSSVMFFWNSFRMIQRPQYVAPIESISSIINSRLNNYPFLFTGDMLWAIGDGSELLPKEDEVTEELEGTSEGAEEVYQEPRDFRGYLNAMIDGTYAPGMDEIDYLGKAYQLFLNEEHQDDYFYIGLMWNYLYDYIDWFEEEISFTGKECLDKSIEAYERCEELYGGEAALYNNMAVVYAEKRERGRVREYIKKALEFGVEESHALSNYLSYIYGWIDNEEPGLLMEDAETVLIYEKNLSMYILYGACAIAKNIHVENAYELLCDADKYYQGKSVMVKILRCICADLISRDSIPILTEIYDYSGVL